MHQGTEFMLPGESGAVVEGVQSVGVQGAVRPPSLFDLAVAGLRRGVPLVTEYVKRGDAIGLHLFHISSHKHRIHIDLCRRVLGSGNGRQRHPVEVSCRQGEVHELVAVQQQVLNIHPVAARVREVHVKRAVGPKRVGGCSPTTPTDRPG